MFYYNRQNKNVLFMDKRELSTHLCDGRELVIKPDIVADFTKMPFEDEQFNLVVFDPPHLEKVGEKLTDNGVAIYEDERPFTDTIKGLKITDTRKYGRAYLTFFIKEE